MIYGYIRVSTDKQDTDNQKIGINEKAKSLNLFIDEWIADDGVSGTKEPEKRQLGRLLNIIKEGDVIICSELSRLGRKLFMIMRILEHCMQVGAKVYTVKDGYELGDNITSKVLAFAFALAAEIERDLISKRTIEGLEKRKRDGVLLGRPVGSKSGGKLKAQKDLVIRYANAGISLTGLARIFKVDRETMRRFLNDNNIPYKKAQMPEYLEEYNRKNIAKNVSILAEFLKDILDMIDKGYTASKIAKALTAKGVKTSTYSVETFLKSTGYYDYYVETNRAIRAERNKNCGEYKNES